MEGNCYTIQGNELQYIPSMFCTLTCCPSCWQIQAAARTVHFVEKTFFSRTGTCFLDCLFYSVQEPDVTGHGSEGSEAVYAVRSPLFSCLVTMDKARNQVILRVNIGRPSSEPRAIDFWLVQCGLYKERRSKFVTLNSFSILWHFCWWDEPDLQCRDDRERGCLKYLSLWRLPAGCVQVSHAHWNILCHFR